MPAKKPAAKKSKSTAATATRTLVDNTTWTPAAADAVIARPATTTVVAASKPKKRATVATIPNLVPASDVDAAYAAKQRLENAEAEFKAITAAIKDAVTIFAAGQATTVNVPGSAEINYVVAAQAVSALQQILALPAVQALLQAAGVAPSAVLVEQRQAAYSVAEDWQRDQPLLATLLGSPDKVAALQGCVEVDRRNGTSIRFVAHED